MASLRTMAAAMAAVALVGVHATEVSLPPCLDPFQPFVYSGCFQEGSSQVLPYRSLSSSDGMTVEKCVAECKGNGYRYAGLVYYGNCYCGTTVNGSPAPESQCSFPCNGNSSQACGGDKTFSIYQDPTFQPIEDATVEDYEALGCWTDDSSLGRALTYRQNSVDSATLTTEKCLQACRDGGFPFAGTQYGGECYCGVVIGNDTYAAPAEECNFPCTGNADQTCGGRNRLNLFVADELLSLEPCGYEPPVSSSTTSVPPETTTSTSAPPDTTTAPPDTTTAPPDTTTAPPDTTTIGTTSTTTTSSVCVTTTVVPPTCEWKCGKWCSSPLPDWNDVHTCKAAWSSCALQVASCFKHAGWPDVLDCFDFGEWCGDVSKYCNSKPRNGCKKNDFWNQKPPKGGNPPKTVTVTTTCAPSTTTKPATTTTKPATTTSQCPVPTPTNICIQPTNSHYGYGPGKPVGGIAMPVVTCNDLAQDWPHYPFKGYTDTDSRKCKRYPRNGCTNACQDACKEQYEDCVDVYAEGCKTKGRKVRDESYFEFAKAVEKRTWRWNDDHGGAVKKCKAQYADCLKVNRGVTGAGKCPKFGGW